MNFKNINKILSRASEIEESEAKEAGTLGFMARMLVQTTLPHRDPQSTTFLRKNGNIKLAIMAHPEMGLPWGTYPRLIFHWLVTEAVKTQSPHLILGSSLSNFMLQLDLSVTGGKTGTIRRLREQMKRLFSATISCTYDDGKSWKIKNIQPVESAALWWDPKDPNQLDLWQSTVTLNKSFFEEITARPVPIDIRVLKVLKDSPMALDLYCWLTYRLSYLKCKTEIPWSMLQNQFGIGYAQTKQGRYSFKKKLLIQLKKVISVYPSAQDIAEGKEGLVISPSRPHVKKISQYI